MQDDLASEPKKSMSTLLHLLQIQYQELAIRFSYVSAT